MGGDNLIDLIESARSDGVVSFTGARGGSGYNTARAVARQQQVVGFITPIAMDNLGHFLSSHRVSDGTRFAVELGFQAVRKCCIKQSFDATIGLGWPVMQVEIQGQDLVCGWDRSLAVYD